MSENSLQIFNNPEFGEIRTILINSEPWLAGKDVAEALGYSNTTKAIRDHINDEDKQLFKENETCSLKTSNYGLVLINESGLYSLILSSKLPKAKEFKHWVTSEVLPSIRKHGAYMTDDVLEKVADNPDLLIELATKLKTERQKNKELQAKNSALSVDNQIMRPKAEFYDELVDRQALTGLRETAKELGIKPKVFTNYLLEHKYLYRTKSGKLMPSQKYVDNGLFVLKECSNEKAKLAGTQTLVTVKGRDIFRQMSIAA